MPFDGIDTFEPHPLAKLGAVERLLATEQQWCKGRLRDAHGRHCLVGAIGHDFYAGKRDGAKGYQFVALVDGG